MLSSDTSHNAVADSARMDCTISRRQSSIILRTKPDLIMLHDDAVEEAAITSAQRIQRPPSRARLTANVIKQRASSTRSISSARTGEHNRSPSLSNITSPGFVNMISSNGNSWTDPSVDVTEIHRLSTISGDDIGKSAPSHCVAAMPTSKRRSSSIMRSSQSLPSRLSTHNSSSLQPRESTSFLSASLCQPSALAKSRSQKSMHPNHRL